VANRRDFIKMGAGLAASTLSAPTATAFASSATAGPVGGSEPNIIFILADDMGFSDLGCFGSEIATRNLDRLASRGMRMAQFYNNPRCCPSRASIMTGLYSQQAHMGDMVVDHGRYPFPEHDGILASNTLTIAEAPNHTNFSSVQSTLGSSNYGQVTGTGSSRIMQLGAKLDF